jgi:hypothetical protein
MHRLGSENVCFSVIYTGWFRALIRYLRRLLVRSFGSGKDNSVFFFRFATFSELRHFYVDFSLISVIVDFYKTETIRFNITCHYEFLVCNERKKTYALFSIFQSSLQSTSFWALFCSCGADLSDLLPVLLSESDNCASAVCTSTNLQRGAPVKRSQKNNKATST